MEKRIVLIIDPNNDDHELQTMRLCDIARIIGTTFTDQFHLRGTLPYGNRLFILYVGDSDLSHGTLYNETASRFASYATDVCCIDDYKVMGRAILAIQDGNVSQNDVDLLYEIVKTKDARIAPPEVHRFIDECESRDISLFSPKLQEMFLSTIPKRELYGEKKA